MDSKVFIASGALESYVMGFATEEEAKLVLEMAALHPEVKLELEEIERSIERHDAEFAIEPPVELRDNIFAIVPEISSNVKSSGKVRRLDGIEQWEENDSAEEELALDAPNFFKYAAGLALLLLIGSAWYIFKLKSEIEVKDRAIQTAENLSYMYKHEWDYYDSMNLVLNHELHVLKTPSMKTVELKGMVLAPEAKAMAYTNTTSGEVYLEILNLPPAPDGMQYQFWGFVDGKPVDAGMIPLEGNLAGIHPMKTVSGSTGYAITLEKKGGHPQPEGKIYVMGNS